ncbi:MAG: hypothetical protein JXB49_23580 [Bacteroidales bacterium]|nr:hypothetical protein [Bacteroidales bacterium]
MIEVTTKDTLIKTDINSNIPFRGSINNTGFNFRKTSESLRFYPVKIKGEFSKEGEETSINLTFYPEPFFYIFRIIWLLILTGLLAILIFSSFSEPYELIAVPFCLALIMLEEYIFRRGFIKGKRVSEEIINRLLKTVK